MKKIFVGSLLMVLLGLTPLAQATLWDRGRGLVYDDVLNITWLQDANYGAGSSYDNGYSTTDGTMTWANAVAWADQLVYGGYDDWRLPTTEPETGNSITYNVTSSEMGYMYYVNLGNVGSPDSGETVIPNATFTDGNGKMVSFQNVQADAYWSGTEYSINLQGAWMFLFHNGGQRPADKNYAGCTWAVRDGDVAPVSLAVDSFRITENKRRGRTTTQMLGTITLPELNVINGGTVQSRITIELFGVLPGGGDLIMSEEATLTVTETPKTLDIRK